MRLLFVIIKILVFTEIKVKLPKVRNNFLLQINPQWDCIVSESSCFQCIMGSREKRNKEIFEQEKNMKIDVSSV